MVSTEMVFQEEKMQKYLIDRGLTDETIDSWEIDLSVRE